MDNQKHERKFEELELQTAQVFSQKFLKLLQGMGYRPGIDKIEISTNFKTEFTTIWRAHSARYNDGESITFYQLNIPDKYVPKNDSRFSDDEDKISISIPLESIFSNMIVDTLKNMGCNFQRARFRFYTNHHDSMTGIIHRKTVLREDYFDVVIPDQVRE